MKSVSQLNNLHSEFKHIGPVSKDNQNDIWERLKAASDLIYERKKEFILSIKDSIGFCLAVQWHPEWNASCDNVSKPLFQNFGKNLRLPSN